MLGGESISNEAGHKAPRLPQTPLNPPVSDQEGSPQDESQQQWPRSVSRGRKTGAAATLELPGEKTRHGDSDTRLKVLREITQKITPGARSVSPVLFLWKQPDLEATEPRVPGEGAPHAGCSYPRKKKMQHVRDGCKRCWEQPNKAVRRKAAGKTHSWVRQPAGSIRKSP